MRCVPRLRSIACSSRMCMLACSILAHARHGRLVVLRSSDPMRRSVVHRPSGGSCGRRDRTGIARAAPDLYGVRRLVTLRVPLAPCAQVHVVEDAGHAVFRDDVAAFNECLGACCDRL